MSTDRWREVRAHFDRLIDLEAQERAARLAALRNTDPEIHGEVVRLLEADADADERLERFDPPTSEARPSLRDRIRAEMRDKLGRALEERYRVEEEVGCGGMAVVFRARDLSRDETVALKVLEPDVARAVDPRRFQREITIERTLDHPGIVPVLESGDADGLLYYVMPFVEGESLRAHIDREGPLPVNKALGIIVQCAAALTHAHERGVIHRDVKPANIVLSLGQARLLDFGIARVLDQADEERLTKSGVSLGTVGYMSPEQAAGERNVDVRTDVYGLGSVLYEMLAGEPAFRGPTAQAILGRQMAEAPPSITVIRPEVSQEIDAAIRRALAPDPDDRMPTARAFSAALEAEQRSSPGR